MGALKWLSKFGLRQVVTVLGEFAVGLLGGLLLGQLLVSTWGESALYTLIIIGFLILVLSNDSPSTQSNRRQSQDRTRDTDQRGRQQRRGSSARTGPRSPTVTRGERLDLDVETIDDYRR